MIEYYSSHSFFFGANSLYLLLFDINSELNKENKLLEWLFFIQSKVGVNANVIIVATKIDILANEISEYNKINKEKRSLEKELMKKNECKKKKKILIFFFIFF